MAGDFFGQKFANVRFILYLCKPIGVWHNWRVDMNKKHSGSKNELKKLHRSSKGRYVLQHWRRLVWGIVSKVFSWWVVIMTLVSSLIALLPDEYGRYLMRGLGYVFAHGYIVAVSFSVMVVVAAILSWPRTKAVYKDKTSDIRVIIECCDLFRQKGMKVIHAVDTFDTELNRIITPKSLHGAFLQLCERNNANIDSQLDDALRHVAKTETDDALPGRKNRYALGTVVPVSVQDEPYCCVSFSHLMPDGNIQITKSDYIQCMKRMWRNLAAPTIRQDEVNVAVMGNKFVDLPAEFSTEQKIDLMIQTFFFAARQKACCRTLRICVHPNDVADIDFASYPTIIKHLAKRPIL